MVFGTFADRARLTFFSLAQVRRSTMGVLRRSPVLRWRYTGPPAQRLLLVPPDLRTADPSLAYELNDGQMGLAGTICEIGDGSPFDAQPPSRDWLRQLHGFGWLRNLAATQDPQMAAQARALMRDWMQRQPRETGVAWQADVVARRIIAWLSHSGFLLREADQEFYDILLESLSRQMRFLVGSYIETPDGAPRLKALIALLLSGLCMSGQQQIIKHHKETFLRELSRQILNDGGHISRNPEVIVDLLLDLLPLRQCFVVRERQAPGELNEAIARMMPMIHFFRLGDHALCRFNGSSFTPFDDIGTVLAYQDVAARAPALAAASGYCRLKSGDMRAIVDVGTPPPLLASSTAHAGCLSFELSIGTTPVFINCGAPAKGSRVGHRFSRRSEAHNTLEINGTSSSEFLSGSKFERFIDEPFLVGPTNVEIENVKPAASLAGEQPGALPVARAAAGAANPDIAGGIAGVTAQHDGYVKRFGVFHQRRVELLENGRVLVGRDRLIPAKSFKGAKFALHFHVHPAVEITVVEEIEHAMMLKLPDGSQWQFMAEGPIFSQIADSIYLAYRHGSRQTAQIVLSGLASGETAISWRLERQTDVTASDRSSADQMSAEMPGNVVKLKPVEDLAKLALGRVELQQTGAEPAQEGPEDAEDAEEKS